MHQSQRLDERLRPDKYKGFAIFSKDGHFKPHDFSRHAVGPKDVLIDILYAGICHSDIHSAYSEWKEGIYPMVPGHEIAGVIKEVGKEVKKDWLNSLAVWL